MEVTPTAHLPSPPNSILNPPSPTPTSSDHPLTTSPSIDHPSTSNTPHYTRSRNPNKPITIDDDTPTLFPQEQVKMELDDPASPIQLPTPTPSIPSFISADPPSSDSDSSSSSDSDGNPKPPRLPKFSRDGIKRPTPSYYYDKEYDASGKGVPKKRRRRGGAKGIPVFEPTMQEFEEQGGFYGFVKRIEKYGMRSGVVKVVPPKEWSEALPPVTTPLHSIRLREPIEQNILGSSGLFRVTNVAKTRIWNPAQWKSFADGDKWKTPDFLGLEKEKELRSEKPTVGAGAGVKIVRKRAAPGTGPPRKKKTGGKKGKSKGKGKGKEVVVLETVEIVGEGGGERVREDEDKGSDGDDEGDNDEDEVMQKEEEDQEKMQTEATPSATALNEEELEDEEEDVVMNDRASTSTLPTAGSTVPMTDNTSQDSPLPSTSTLSTPTIVQPPKKRRPTNMQRAEPTIEEWEEFEKVYTELPNGMKKEDYTVELMREVERRYWRTLTFGEPPWYGADMKGSLFDPSTKSWNVASLGDLLPQLAPSSCKIPGVVSPYLYFGMWRATFAWHVEDADLYSINYIHFGAPKFWYAVPQEESGRFERTMEGFFPTDRTKCGQFLRHKAFLASPRVLANAGITLNRVVQLPGEFILTYPRGYHSGFNVGFNAAESINFATERWLPIGRKTKSCSCIGDSVNIDVDIWLKEAALAEEVAKKEVVNSLVSSTSTSLTKRKRSVASPIKSETPSIPLPPAKKKKLPPAAPTPSSTIQVVIVPAPLSKKAQKEAEKVAKEESWVCALCPDIAVEGLVEIGEPGVKSKKKLKAHRICVMFTPATWIDVDPVTNEEMIRGYGRIEKARWKLNCQLCKEKHGTKVQCTKGKCPKAFHVTCALQENSGIFLDATILEDGVRVSLLELARKEIDAEKDGKDPLPHKVAIPHRAVPIEESHAFPSASGSISVDVAMAPPPTSTQPITTPVPVEVLVTETPIVASSNPPLPSPALSVSTSDSSVLPPSAAAQAISPSAAAPPLVPVGAIASSIITESSTLPAITPASVQSVAPAVVPGTSSYQLINGVVVVPVGSSSGTSSYQLIDGVVVVPVVSSSGTAAPPPPVVDEGIKLTVLCRMHNPEYQKLENARKAAELTARVDVLLPQARIRVKTSGGAFEVTYSHSLAFKEAVTVIFDDGKRSDVKWRNIIWPDSPEIAKKKEEAAEKARAEKPYVYEHRPIQPTKRSSYTSPAVGNQQQQPPQARQAFSAYTPYAQPYYPYPTPPSSNQPQTQSGGIAPHLQPPRLQIPSAFSSYPSPGGKGPTSFSPYQVPGGSPYPYPIPQSPHNYGMPYGAPAFTQMPSYWPPHPSGYPSNPSFGQYRPMSSPAPPSASPHPPSSSQPSAPAPSIQQKRAYPYMAPPVLNPATVPSTSSSPYPPTGPHPSFSLPPSAGASTLPPPAPPFPSSRPSSSGPTIASRPSISSLLLAAVGIQQHPKPVGASPESDMSLTTVSVGAADAVPISQTGGGASDGSGGGNNTSAS